METPLRVLPHNIQAEQTVLGCMIKDKTSIAQAAETLRGNDFYRESHKIIFEAILELCSKDVPVDMVTLIEKLKSTERLQIRSEEHTSELQSRQYLVCRLLLEKKK